MSCAYLYFCTIHTCVLCTRASMCLGCMRQPMRYACVCCCAGAHTVNTAALWTEGAPWSGQVCVFCSHCLYRYFILALIAAYLYLGACMRDCALTFVLVSAWTCRLCLCVWISVCLSVYFFCTLFLFVCSIKCTADRRRLTGGTFYAAIG